MTTGRIWQRLRVMGSLAMAGNDHLLSLQGRQHAHLHISVFRDFWLSWQSFVAFGACLLDAVHRLLSSSCAAARTCGVPIGWETPR